MLFTPPLTATTATATAAGLPMSTAATSSPAATMPASLALTVLPKSSVATVLLTTMAAALLPLPIATTTALLRLALLRGLLRGVTTPIRLGFGVRHLPITTHSGIRLSNRWSLTRLRLRLTRGFHGCFPDRRGLGPMLNG